MECRECQTSEFVENTGSQIICTNCGTVLEESQIVSDVTFAENSAGGAVVQGSYVGNEQRGARTQGPGGYRSGGAGASREQTVANAKHAIRALGSAKHVPPNTIEKAGRLFMLALQGGTFKPDGPEPKNFVLGRRSEYTQASCLYVACRMDKTNHMLIDFADAIGVNVFILGRSYLRLIRCLDLKMPVIDPSIYISRFASLLDFGEETQRVAQDATRLVHRFNKDWITHGRRPAGICGACLLLAARMNNFRRSVAEIIQVVKIADITLRKRLDEFKRTPSSKLTIDDFRSIWLEEEMEPPAFYLARMPKKSKKSISAAKRLKGESGHDEEDDDEDDGNEADDEDMAPKRDGPDEVDIGDDPNVEALADQAAREEISRYLDGEEAQAISQTSSRKKETSVKPGTVDGGAENDQDDFADLDDEELDSFINSEAEVRIKERVWMEFNKDYLEKVLERQLKMEADIKAGIKVAPSRRKRGSVKPREHSAAPSTAAESARQLMRKRNFSKRLNYDVLDSLFDPTDVKSTGVKRARDEDEEDDEEEDDEDEEEDDDAADERAVNEKMMEPTRFVSDAENTDGEVVIAGEDGEEIVVQTARRNGAQRHARRKNGKAARSENEESGTDGDNWRRGLSRDLLRADTYDDDLYEDDGDGIL